MATRVVRSVRQMQGLAGRLRCQGRVGFVPTMGYLHEGHLDLVRRCNRLVDSTVVSIFVNPAQFGPKEDLARYPRDFDRDRKLLEREGVDIVFCPKASDMYPPGYATWVEVDRLTTGMCGRFRSGHFRGVATVVLKLFNIVRPHVAVFGAKDWQQAAVIRRIAADLDTGTRIVVAPTTREKDGLAMSSRNTYLSRPQRAEAPVLYRALRDARRLVADGERDAGKVARRVRQMVRGRSSGSVQYVEVVDPDTLEPVRRISGPVVIALAVWFGKTRLIDNTLCKPG